MADSIEILFSLALLAEGSEIADPVRLNQLTLELLQKIVCPFVIIRVTDKIRTKGMAERVGFEPTIPVKVCPLSRRIVSTAHAPLRKTVVSCQPSVASKPRLLLVEMTSLG